MKNNKKKKKGKGINYSTLRCPYCGSSVIYRSADGIYKDNSKNSMLYVCSKYPECDAYVRTHPNTNVPMGTLANRRLRELRKEAHKYFNRIYEEGYMTKQDAYRWLSFAISAPMSHTHIGNLGEYYCEVVIKESKRILANKEKAGDIKQEETA